MSSAPSLAIGSTNQVSNAACAGRAVPFYNIEEFPEEYAAVEKEDIDIDTSGPYDFPFEFVDSNE